MFEIIRVTTLLFQKFLGEFLFTKIEQNDKPREKLLIATHY